LIVSIGNAVVMLCAGGVSMGVVDESLVREFSTSLKDALGGNVRKIILYGSRARGDYSADSDYDFIVVVASHSKGVRDLVIDIEVDILDKYGEVISSLLYDEDEWSRECRYPLGINVQREGVLV